MATVLAISPHLDDACLSYGAQLAQRAADGDRVVVYTVFAGSPTTPLSPLAARYHADWGGHVDPLSSRRREDAEAMRLLGATPVHGGFLDAIYRRTPDGWLVGARADLFTATSADEPGLVPEIALTVAELIAEFAPDQVVTAAAAGFHIDHRRARDATLLAARQADVPFVLWEDLPYALRSPEFPALGTDVALRPGHALSSAAARDVKFRALECYTSQLPMLRHNGEAVLDALGRHSRKLSGDEHYAERVYSSVNGRAHAG
jgi:LmbE family N-acetylglucosaminyl deacetylase